VDPQTTETTELLLAWANGDKRALDALTTRVYQELRRMAGHFMQGERAGRTLQATGLVHEVYARLIDVKNVKLEGRAHFFAICAQQMRRILLDAARKRATSKRGGAVGRINLNYALDVSEKKDRQLIALNDALDRLNQVDPRKAKVVELRYFGGLSIEETATVLSLSKETITRDWRMARSWLLLELDGSGQRIGPARS
jgi:RNA polymerase sigma factor (TIGR02999 family)